MISGWLQKRIRLIGAVFFGLYLTALIYFLFFAEAYGRTSGAAAYNLVPFREIIRFVRFRKLLGMRAVLLNLAGNVIGFVPFGVLLPLLVRSARSLRRTVLLSLEVSMLVEIAQLLFRVGSFDVDDMILNTLGGLLGYLMFVFLRHWYRSRRRENTDREEHS